MLKYTEFSAKTSEEAIEVGLKTLGITREEAEIHILEEGKKKLFGSTKARVEIARKADEEEETSKEPEKEPESEEKSGVHYDASGRSDGERAVEFLEGLFSLLKITACTELKNEGEKIEINVTAAHNNDVIGKGGVMLDAIQTIAGAVANIGRDDYKRVVVDCENYRENREAALEAIAEKLAAKSLRLGKKLKMDPMNPYERRIIHAALAKNPAVKTESEGKEPYRCIVIIPENDRFPDSPAISTRGDRQNRGGYGGNRGGYDRRPYNRGEGSRGGFNREKYQRDGGRRPYNRENRDYNRDNREGGTNMNERRGYDKPRTSGYKKPSSDFFGTFLGNSKDNKDE